MINKSSIASYNTDIIANKTQEGIENDPSSMG